MRILVWALILIGFALAGLSQPADLGLNMGAEEFETYRVYGILAVSVLLVMEALLLIARRPMAGKLDSSPVVNSSALEAMAAERDKLQRSLRETELKLEKVEDLRKQATAARGDREVMNFMSLLQTKGRFVDFLMDDISQYQDAQIGAAARVVHQGCVEVVKDYFDISPVSESQEGATMTLGQDYDAQKFKVLGQVRGEPPFTGRILHRGWRTEDVRLPQAIESSAKDFKVIMPAEIEVQ